ncbi:MAG: DUF3786 domain-containing protein [Pseudomonadota bacterium]
MLPKQENYQLARQMAVDGLGQSDLQERAAKSGGRYESDSEGEARIRLEYLGRELLISFPAGTIKATHGPGPIPLREEILVLHYLGKATGTAPTGRWISFAEISGGAFYHPVFIQRCQFPLVRFFGSDPEGLKTVAERMPGGPLDFGDVGVKIQAFPFIPLALILWRGDTEFPAEGNLLFDDSITECLPVEDIVILAETVVWRLIKNKNADSPQRAQRTLS